MENRILSAPLLRWFRVQHHIRCVEQTITAALTAGLVNKHTSTQIKGPYLQIDVVKHPRAAGPLSSLVTNLQTQSVQKQELPKRSELFQQASCAD